MEIRCPHKLFAVLKDGILEIKCGSRLCGAGSGTVVLHDFDPVTGDLIRTRKFKDPTQLGGKK